TINKKFRVFRGTYARGKREFREALKTKTHARANTANEQKKQDFLCFSIFRTHYTREKKLSLLL
ncbi:hypothetical protein, partial [Priestia megaterium]|uniref:hypothetical protein n=1 Tax=Priestia megaterium TaxID=1404 RepID=UPI00196B4C08